MAMEDILPLNNNKKVLIALQLYIVKGSNSNNTLKH